MARGEYWEIEVRHAELGKYRHIRGTDKNVVEQKAEAQRNQWDIQWARESAARLKKIECENISELKASVMLEKEKKKRIAAARTYKAVEAIDAVRNILANSLDANSVVGWDSLKSTDDFNVPIPILKLPKEPAAAKLPTRPKPTEIPVAPNLLDAEFQPKSHWLAKLIPSKKLAAIGDAKKRFEDATSKYIENVKQTEKTNKDALSEWDLRIEKIKNKEEMSHADWVNKCDSVKSKHATMMVDWEKSRNEFLTSQDISNKAIVNTRKLWLAGDRGAVIDYCRMVLENSSHPKYFLRKWDVDYIPDTRTVVVEYVLPAPDDMPVLIEVKYVQSRDEFQEKHMSAKERSTIYESTLYQVTLRTIHELFEADVAKVIDSVVFNGLVTSIDKSSGRKVTACILSVQSGKDEFLPLNLSVIDPKVCFKSLRGVAASSLSGLVPIPPMLTINKSDRRFVESYAVADSMNESTNLAAMHWEDFEHLIREIFEKEFSSVGGEVRVTQASRDGGVDAVAFDPDPIRGGKIVIQAKRYTNTVGVSAVRDLYGTVMNEGATKGILVSTSSYGPDAYAFAKGKPLSLLNGGNLLHLLAKHGYRAKIDMKEAKARQLEDLTNSDNNERGRR